MHRIKQWLIKGNSVPSGLEMTLAMLFTTLALASCALLMPTKTPQTIPPGVQAEASASASGQTILAPGFCDNAKPIAWSKHMTDSQIEQIKEHDAVGHRLCGWPQ